MTSRRCRGVTASSALPLAACSSSRATIAPCLINYPSRAEKDALVLGCQMKRAHETGPAESRRPAPPKCAEVPCPAVRRGQLLIRTLAHADLRGHRAHAGRFGKAGGSRRRASSPTRCAWCSTRCGPTGLLPTLEAVRNKLDQPLPLGYCNVGVSLHWATACPASRSATASSRNGQHAEVVSVPVNLCAKFPERVRTTTPRLHRARRDRAAGHSAGAADARRGVVVTGLGLIGLLTVQLLRAHGCRVLGIDFDPSKLALARRFGAEVVDLAAGDDPVAAGDGILARARRRRRDRHRRDARAASRCTRPR